ncbi:GroES-like protein [Laetiporus sulphureus 93-53]|uniref:GroES-like protein n=1 Tax=Laetiporus sulphureus 93-53 TaxID=1314785 RepID=A0A165BF58_9APHY|nr:GroES-like protein [Laetiporus sulphureus 93-53]KZT00923.1 GroES-like protein [Laetiporus sulphureus 93-53]
MRHQTALLLTSRQGHFALGISKLPKPGPGEILINVRATALNPVDWKIYALGIIVNKYPAVLGSDIAGVVEDVGEGVAGFSRGDRVLTQGVINVNSHSSFQQYALGFSDVTAKIPEHLTFEQAATIPLALATAAVGLFNQYSESGSAHLYPPWEPGGRGKYDGEPFLVFGGSSSVGQYVIQLAKLAGFEPIITTASPHNAKYLLDLGATHVLDRHLSADDTRSEIFHITSKPIQTIYDAVSLLETQNMAYDILATGGCLVLVLNEVLDKKKKREDKRVVKVSGSTVVPEENRAMGISLYSRLSALLDEGIIKPNRVEILPNGLEGISDGLARLGNGVSNIKLVARPMDTL